MGREAVVAGLFYKGTAEALREQINQLITPNAPKKKAIGAVSPHAGYLYSGAVAGAVFSRIELEDTCVILGPNHSGQGAPLSIMPEGTWQTPLGTVRIDSKLASRILQQCPALHPDTLAHLHEHSIEVQLPFLQYFKKDIKIIPVLLSPMQPEIYKKIGKGLAEAIKEFGKGANIIASSDMTHYESVESARQKDFAAIESIRDLDEDALFKTIEEMNITMCGYAPAMTLITAAKDLGAGKAELIDYRHSGEVTGDDQKVVGYAGIIIS